MCGRYTLSVPPQVLRERFDAPVADYQPTYNASPGQKLPVLHREGEKSIDLLRWGLVPSWAQKDTGGHINARVESIKDKPSFADAYRERRCIVPTDGFYEWKDGTPYYVEFERVVGLAGIWEKWVPEKRQSGLGEFGDDDGEGDCDSENHERTLKSFAILTTEANEKIRPLHERMAVLLAEDEERSWLNGSLGADSLETRDEPADIRRVSDRVNDTSNDDERLIKAVEN